MIIPQTIAGLPPADTLHDILSFQKRNTMKIVLESEESDSKKPSGFVSNGTLPVEELLSNLSISGKEPDPKDGKPVTGKDDTFVQEENGINEDEEIDVSKLVCKGPLRSRHNPSRSDPYDFPTQPSRAQTTFINGRQMAGSQVSEAVWVESHENEIPSSVAELSELQTPTPILGTFSQSWNNIEKFDNLDCPELYEFTADEISRVVGLHNNIDDLDAISKIAVDEGFDQAKIFTSAEPNLSDSFSGVQLNLSEYFSEVQPNIPDNFSSVQINSLDSNGVVQNFSEGMSNEDPHSPDSAYGSVGLVESPRNSPKSDFCMPHSVSPRYQDHVDPDITQIENFRQQFLSGCDDNVPSWQLEQSLPRAPINIPTQDVQPLQYVELLDISCPPNISSYNYNIPSRDDKGCILNVPITCQDVAPQLHQTPCTPPMNINVQNPCQEKKKTNQESRPKKSPTPLQSTGHCNVKPSYRKMTDQTLQKRLESMMKPVRKEAVWKKTIFETPAEFCKKNKNDQTYLMELLLFEPRLPCLVEAVYTRVGRIKSEKLTDLLCHRDKFGHCALYQAATLHYDIPEIAAYIAETYASSGCDVNRPYRNGNTLLHYLAQLGDKFERVLDELLRLSVNGERIFRIDQRNDMGNTPLHIAAEYHMTGSAGSTFGIAATLIKHRGSICLQNSVGETPLHVAARSKSCEPEYFRKLLEQRGAENLQDENGNTPLHLVALSVNVHNVEMLKKVIDHLRTSKARTDVKNKAGQCPLDNVHQHCKEVIRNIVQQKRQ